MQPTFPSRTDPAGNLSLLWAVVPNHQQQVARHVPDMRGLLMGSRAGLASTILFTGYAVASAAIIAVMIWRAI